MPIKIDLDITDPSNERIILPIERKEIIHLYSDELHAAIPSYSLEEIMGEKLRSLYERTRPRDIYDVYHLLSRVEKSIAKEVFYKKCEYKGINPKISHIFLKKEQYQMAWEKSLKHQMKQLPVFEGIFDAVSSYLKELGITE